MRSILICLIVAFTLVSLKVSAQIEKASPAKMHPDSMQKRADLMRQHTIFTKDPEKISKVHDVLIVYELAKEKLLIVDEPTDEQRFHWQKLIAERNIALSKLLSREELRVLVSGLERISPKRKPAPVFPKESKEIILPKLAQDPILN